METTDHHDWCGSKSTNDGQDNNLNFGVHGPTDLSQFGIHLESDLKEDQDIDKTDLIPLKTDDGL